MSLKELTTKWIKDFNNAASLQGAPTLSEEDHVLDEGVIGIGDQVLVIIEEDLEQECGYHLVLCPNKHGDPIKVATAFSLAYESKNELPISLGLGFWMEGDTMHWVGEDDELPPENCLNCETCDCHKQDDNPTIQ